MRVYQSDTGEWIATDDHGVKVRGKTREEAKAAYRAIVPDEPKIEPQKRPGRPAR